MTIEAKRFMGTWLGVVQNALGQPDETDHVYLVIGPDGDFIGVRSRLLHGATNGFAWTGQVTLDGADQGYTAWKSVGQSGIEVLGFGSLSINEAGHLVGTLTSGDTQFGTARFSLDLVRL